MLMCFRNRFGTLLTRFDLYQLGHLCSDIWIVKFCYFLCKFISMFKEVCYANSKPRLSLGKDTFFSWHNICRKPHLYLLQFVGNPCVFVSSKPLSTGVVFMLLFTIYLLAGRMLVPAACHHSRGGRRCWGEKGRVTSSVAIMLRADIKSWVG